MGYLTKESVINAWYAGQGQVDSDDWKYRRITEAETDLPEYVHDHMLRVALYLFQRNPEAQAYVSMMRDFPVGEGIRFRAQDSRVQEYLEEFWYDYDNDWDRRLRTIAQDLSNLGEQGLVLRHEPSGLLRVEHLSPFNISGVVASPRDAFATASLLVTKESLVPQPETDAEFRHLYFDLSTQLVKGDCLYIAINKTADAHRGISDIFATADWMDIREQFLFNRARRAAFVNMFLLDVTVKNATRKKIEDLRKYFQEQASQPGSMFVHSDDAKADFISPQLGGSDAALESALFEGYINTGLGIPPHWKGTAVTTGRTAGPEAAEPMYKRIRTRQNELADFLRKLFRAQIDYRVELDQLPADVSRDVRILMPRVAKRDVLRMAGAFSRFVEGAQLGQEIGLLSPEEQKELLRDFLAELGLSMEPLGVAERLKGKEQPREL